ncbi:hypothetical protein Tco_0708859 [Tanacetum coccineum]
MCRIPSEDPYDEVARQLLEQAPRSLEYVPDPMELEDHVPFASHLHAPRPFYPHLSERPRTRAAMAQMRAAAPSTYHPLLPSGTPPLLPIPLPAPSTSRRADIPEADTPPRKRLLLTAPKPGFVDTVETRVRDTERRMMAALEVVNLRVSYQVDVRRLELGPEAYSRALEHDYSLAVLQARRHEWQRQDADDRAMRHNHALCQGYGGLEHAMTP